MTKGAKQPPQFKSLRVLTYMVSALLLLDVCVCVVAIIFYLLRVYALSQGTGCSYVLEIVAAVLALLVVRKIDLRQRESALQMAKLNPAGNLNA
jgi:hypothetical protein